ncbi:MAG: c-type cytochrome domain-containing protein [Planctomycetaceae bacterium]
MLRVISLLIGLVTVLVAKQATGPAGDSAAAARHRRIALYILGGFGICSALAVAMVGAAVFALMQHGPPPNAAHNQPGEAALAKAEGLIVGDSRGTAHGNTPAAQELARQFALVMEEVDKKAFTDTNAKFKLSGGHYVTFCELQHDYCVFVVHVPEYRRFESSAKDVLEKLAWGAAQRIAGTAMPADSRLAVGLRGVLLYGAVLEGMVGGGESHFVRSDERQRLFTYFLDSTPRLPATAEPVALALAMEPADAAAVEEPVTDAEVHEEPTAALESLSPAPFALTSAAAEPELETAVDGTTPDDAELANGSDSKTAIESTVATPGETLLAQAPAALPAAPANVATDPGAVELAKKAEAALKASCYRCHGEDGTSEGGFNFVLNLEKLSKSLISPRNPAGSLLYERMTATDQSVMPPPKENPRPSAEDIAAIKAWIEAGAPVLAAAEQRNFITSDQVIDSILADVQKANERTRRFLRYFTLTHLYNAGVSEDELQTYRNAFTKLANSLSWNTDLIVPKAIDEARTIFRIDIRDLNWNSDTWTAIEDANPYFLEFATSKAKSCYDETEARMPFVRADWFVFAASKPPLYHAVLGLPDTDEQLEEQLHVNVVANIEQEQAIRAAFNRSGVSQNNRLIEWHKSPYGSYWKSYDFGGNAGRQNLFAYPLGPGNEADSFEHDGGEIIFTLPNGLQGYLLVDGKGGRIDQGPTNIVSDPRRANRAVTNGVSCMSCHFAGLIPKSDEVGAVVRANPKAFKNSADILALYRDPQELGDKLERDTRRFAEALEKLDITSLTRSGEPISTMAARFEEELDVRLASSEFGLTPDEFNSRLDDCSEVIARTFGVLRVPAGTLKRDVFVASFADAVKDLRVLDTKAAATGKKPGGTATARRTPARTPIPKTPRMTTPERTPRRTARNRPQNTPVPKEGAGGSAPVMKITGLRGSIKALAFSPDGAQLAIGKLDSSVILQDVAKNQQLDIKENRNPLQQATACVFSPDGTRLLAAGYSGTIVVFEVTRDGRLNAVGQYVGHSSEIKCLDISDDGKLALSAGSRDKSLHCWKIDGGQPEAILTGFPEEIADCRFGNGGRTALGCDGLVVLEFNISKQTTARQLSLNRQSHTNHCVAFSPDGDFVAVSELYAIHVWNLKDSTAMPVLQDNEIQWTMRFTPDGDRIISGGHQKVNVWDVRKHIKTHSLNLEGNGYVQSLAISPDGDYVAASPSRDVDIFELPAKKR